MTSARSTLVHVSSIESENSYYIESENSSIVAENSIIEPENSSIKSEYSSIESINQPKATSDCKFSPDEFADFFQKQGQRNSFVHVECQPTTDRAQTVSSPM